MASNLNVTSADLVELSKQFAQLSASCGDLLKGIQGQVGILNNVWKGDAATSFSNNISSTYDAFTKATTYLGEMSTNLATAAANYDEVERMNTIAAKG